MGSDMDDVKAEGRKAQGKAEEKMDRAKEAMKEKFEERSKEHSTRSLGKPAQPDV